MLGSTNVFGQNNSSNNPFAPKPFGSTTPFGSQMGSSIFGGTSTGVFGASPSPAFGSLIPAFGSSSTPAFGSSSTSFGGSSGSSSTSAFGTSSSPFGASSSPAFGASSTPAFRFGSTLVSYSATAEADGGASGQTAKLESISAMHAYKDKSHEELRWEEYQAYKDKSHEELRWEDYQQSQFFSSPALTIAQPGSTFGQNPSPFGLTNRLKECLCLRGTGFESYDAFANAYGVFGSTPTQTNAFGSATQQPSQLAFGSSIFGFQTGASSHQDYVKYKIRHQDWPHFWQLH